ncbi:hypothetical protein N312_01566, partial [Balearica regulorum gibbericeps]
MDLSGSSPLSFSSMRFFDVSCLASSSILFHLLESSHSLEDSSSISSLLASLGWKMSSSPCIPSSSRRCLPLSARGCSSSSSSELLPSLPNPRASSLS